MAKFTVQGLGLPFGCELREQVRFRVDGGKRIHESSAGIYRISRGLRDLPGAGVKVWSLGRRSGSSKAEECIREVMDDEDEDEYEDDQEKGDEEGDFEVDDLSCFRGLVLDISYRPVNVVCWKRAICLEFSDIFSSKSQSIHMSILNLDVTNM